MKQLTLTALLIMLIGSSTYAQTTNKYTLSDCIRIGLERNAAAMNARCDEAIAEARIKQVGSEAFPHLSLESSYTRLDETQEFELEGESVAIGSEDNYSLTATLSQNLYTGGRIRAALDSRDATRSNAHAGRAEINARILFDIKKLFYDVLLLESTITARRDSTKQLEDLVQQTEDRFNAKTASEFELISARVKLANERPPLIAAQGNHVSAIAAFRRLVNMDSGPFVLDGKLEYQPRELESEKLKLAALAAQPSIAAMTALVELREADIQSSKAQRLPDLSAFLKYNGANSYGFASFEDDWEWHWNAGLMLSWNLWDSGLTSGRIAEKKLVHEKAVTDLRDLRDTVSLAIIQAKQNITEARAQVEAGRENVILAEKGLAIARARLDGGLGTTLEFSDANLGLKTAKLGLSNALRNHMTALAELEYASGLSLDQIEELSRQTKGTEQ